MSDPAKGTRIEFPADDAAAFARGTEAFRDGVAANPKLSKIGNRVAAVLPKFLNRDVGYLWPTDQQIADDLNTSLRSVGKGMIDLDRYGHIERQTRFRHGDDRRAGGRMRRIFLCVPCRENSTSDNKPETAKVENKRRNERNTNERNERNVLGNERKDGCRITSNHITSDSSLSDIKVSSYVRTGARGDERNTCPGWGEDEAFLSNFNDTFGRHLSDAGAIDPDGPAFFNLVGKAFDETTRSDDMFAPVYWKMVCATRQGTIREFFLQRARSIDVSRRAAA